MAGYKKKGPTRKAPKKRKVQSLDASFIKRGRAAKVRRAILPV